MSSDDYLPPVSDSDFEDLELRKLLKELDLQDFDGEHAETFAADFAGVENLSPPQFRRLGLDVALFAGLSGAWEFAVKILQKLRDLGDDRIEVTLFMLRSLVELERFAEAIALAQATRWPQPKMLHVNYLMGLSYEALGVRDQAKLRFEAVAKLDAVYRNVSQKLQNY